VNGVLGAISTGIETFPGCDVGPIHEFVGRLCIKDGLPSWCWDHDVRDGYSFTAQEPPNGFQLTRLVAVEGYSTELECAVAALARMLKEVGK